MIVYDWQYENCEGRGLVAWELMEVEGGTQLTIANTVMEEFPSDVPAFRRESCEAGWQYFVAQLKDYAEKKSTGA